jgi:hypothetical protein
MTLALNIIRKQSTSWKLKLNRDADETGYLKQAYQLIGYYYWATKNDLESAKPYYQKLLVLDPNDKNANAALAPAPAEDNTTKQQ